MKAILLALLISISLSDGFQLKKNFAIQSKWQSNAISMSVAQLKHEENLRKEAFERVIEKESTAIKFQYEPVILSDYVLKLNIYTLV